MNAIRGALLGVLMLALPVAVEAATFVVNTTADGHDANPGDGVCETAPGNGVCTLRAAIDETNVLPGADTIIVPAGDYVPNSALSPTFTTHYVVHDSLTLNGAGASVTTIGGGGRGIIRFDGPIQASMSGVTIRNGVGGSGTGSAFDAGGITNNGGASLTLSGLVVTQNVGNCGPAGIWNILGTVTLTESTVSGNTNDSTGCAGHPAGGGIYNSSAMVVSKVTINGNAAQLGAGVANDVQNTGATMTMTNVTITGNTGFDTIFTNSGMQLNNVTVVGATTGPMTLGNTIIASDPSGRPCQGTLTSLGHNLIQPSCYTIVGDSTGNILGADPMLGPLADNGGRTFTRALLPGSPAIDKGDNATCAPTDQRGLMRPQDGNGDGVAICDIGAFEVAVQTSFAAVLPLSRSVQVGGAQASAFATIINAGAATAVNCAPAPPSTPPGGLGPFIYQTTTPANVLTGTPNTPANIAPGAFQGYVFGFAPTAAIPQTSLAMQFLCDNALPAASVSGVNNLFIVAETAPVPDTIAIMSTISGDGVVHIPGAGGLQLFAIGSSNVGATGTIVVSADTGGSALPLTLTVCESDAGGNCLAPPAPTVTVDYASGTNRSFKFFAQASGAIPFDPANNRLLVRLIQGGVLRGATSAAVCTGC